MPHVRMLQAWMQAHPTVDWMMWLEIWEMVVVAMALCEEQRAPSEERHDYMNSLGGSHAMRDAKAADTNNKTKLDPFNQLCFRSLSLLSSLSLFQCSFECRACDKD